MLTQSTIFFLIYLCILESIWWDLFTDIFFHFRNCSFERSKNNFDRISTILISAKSGIKHILSKLEKVASQLIDNKIDFDESNPASSLWTIGNVLVELVARIREREMNNLHDFDSEKINEDGYQERLSNEDFVDNLFHARPFNQRIPLPSAKDDIFEIDDEVYGDLDEEELSRDIAKKASIQVFKTANRAANKVSKPDRS